MQSVVPGLLAALASLEGPYLAGPKDGPPKMGVC